MGELQQDDKMLTQDMRLSELDMVSPDSLVVCFLCYRLQGHHDVEAITSSFRKGVASASESLYLLNGKITFDSHGKPNKSLEYGSLPFHVRKFEFGQYKSMDELAKRRFNPSEFDQRRLVPEEAYSPVDGKKNICQVQLNFIPGGLIFTLAVNHIASDGGTRDLILRLIVQNTRRYLRNEEPGSQIEFNLRRDEFDIKPEIASVSREELVEKVKDYQVVDCTIKPPSNGVPPSPPRIKSLLYRIEGPALEELKASCKPIDGVASYISTHDAVVSLVWKSIMRIRHTLNPQLKQARLLHPVDLRRRPGSTLTTNYFGNAVIVNSIGPVPIEDITGPDGLSIASSLIRQTINNTRQDSVAPIVALSKKLAPTEKLAFRPRGGLGEENVMLTTWHFMSVPEYDFGIGKPCAVRTWAAPVSGFFLMFPSCSEDPKFRSYEFLLVLPDKEQEMMREDEEVRKWFQIEE